MWRDSKISLPFAYLLLQEGMHYVPIIDPGISAAEPPHTYPPWDEGVHLRVFVRNSSNMPFVGKVGVFYVNYFDFFLFVHLFF